MAATPPLFLSLQFMRPTDCLGCTTPISVFQKREWDLALLGQMTSSSPITWLGIRFTWYKFGCQFLPLAGWWFSKKEACELGRYPKTILFQGGYLVFSTPDSLWTNLTFSTRSSQVMSSKFVFAWPVIKCSRKQIKQLNKWHLKLKVSMKKSSFYASLKK